MSLAQLASYGAASDEDEDEEGSRSRQRSGSKKFPRLLADERQSSRSSPRSRSMPAPGAVTTPLKQEEGNGMSESSSERLAATSLNTDYALNSADAETVHAEQHDSYTKATTGDVVGFPGRVISQLSIKINMPPEPSGGIDPDAERKFFEKIATSYPGGINESIKRRKDFRNPSIYEKLIASFKIEEKGTNFPSSMFDMKRFGPESYYDNLAKVQNTYMEKLSAAESSRKRAGGATSSGVTSTTLGAVASSSAALAPAKRNINTTASSGAAAPVADSVTKEARTRKSKWDR